MKAVVAAFNQEKALVGAFSVITNLGWSFLKHQPAASSQRCAATYELGAQNISCICNFYPEFIFLHLREKEPISAAKSFNIIGSLKKITYVLDLPFHLHSHIAIVILHGPEPFLYLLLFTFPSKFDTLCKGMFDN